MKKLFFSLSLLLIGFAGFSQSAEFTNGMKGLLMKMEASKSPEAFHAAANGFERIAAAEPKQWLPKYYAAYCYVMEAMNSTDKEKIDGIVDLADAHLEAALEIEKNDEIICLQSLCKTARINVNAMTRGMKFGPQAARLLETAGAMNAGNPRVFFLKGQSAFYTPEAYGGGKDKAKELFTKAVELYKNFKPLNDLMPTWGADDATKMLAECSK